MAAKKTTKKKPAKRGKSKAQAKTKAKAKPRARARKPPSDPGQIAKFLKEVLDAAEGGDGLFTPEETARIALYFVSDPLVGHGAKTVFLNTKHMAEREMHARVCADRDYKLACEKLELAKREQAFREELARKGVYPIAEVIIGKPPPPPGVEDPPEVGD